MRVSIAIDIANGDRPLRPVLPDRRSTTYAGPLSPFIAQLAVAYLQAPAAWALERRAHSKAIAGYQTSPPGCSVKLDRSV
jgi:hypothetical protein